MTRTRVTLITLAGVALAGTLGVGAAASILDATSRASPVVSTGSGMMGRAHSGMAGRWTLPGDGRPVTSLAAARHRTGLLADQLGLITGEVAQFSNGFYAQLLDTEGRGAIEVLVSRTGGVSIEYGPAMTWNTRYGMHVTTADGPARVSADQARQLAQRSLDDQHPGLTASRPELFPGYYTMKTTQADRIIGMMSVNAFTGAVWYHNWHGAFVGLDRG